jgi:hypothetical protein
VLLSAKTASRPLQQLAEAPVILQRRKACCTVGVEQAALGLQGKSCSCSLGSAAKSCCFEGPRERAESPSFAPKNLCHHQLFNMRSAAPPCQVGHDHSITPKLMLQQLFVLQQSIIMIYARHARRETLITQPLTRALDARSCGKIRRRRRTCRCPKHHYQQSQAQLARLPVASHRNAGQISECVRQLVCVRPPDSSACSSTDHDKCIHLNRIVWQLCFWHATLCGRLHCTVTTVVTMVLINKPSHTAAALAHVLPLRTQETSCTT